MNKDIIKKAFADAEKEQQEQEIKQIKDIVQKHLDEIERLSKNKKEVEERIKVHREILDDLKAGRLDKIEEYLEKDEHARSIALIIVKKVEREYIPMYPWRSPWTIEWANPFHNYPQMIYGNGLSATTSGGALGSNLTGASAGLTATGTSFANFTSGTYTVGAKTINL